MAGNHPKGGECRLRRSLPGLNPQSSANKIPLNPRAALPGEAVLHVLNLTVTLGYTGNAGGQTWAGIR